MAIYRPQRRRWPALALAAGLGLLLGVALGLAVAGSDDPDVSAAAAEARTRLTEAAGLLEVAEVEYQESVADGEVTQEAEYEGALRALERSRSRYLQARPGLIALAPQVADDLDARYGDLALNMEERAPEQGVSEAAAELIELLRGDPP
ncbi:MAG: hypothetical protein ABR529_03370 [Actinomycetota bacterium]